MDLNHPKVILHISRKVSQKINKTLTDRENLSIIAYLSHIKPNPSSNHSLSTIINYLSHHITTSPTLDPQIDDQSDIKSWQKETIKNNYSYDQPQIDHTFIKRDINFHTETTPSTNTYDTDLTESVSREINVDSLFDINDLFTLQRLISPKTHHRSVFVLLDTSNIDSELSSDTKFGWNFSNNSILKTGAINGIGANGSLVGMHIFPITTTLTRAPSAVYSASSSPQVVTTAGQSTIYTNDFINTNNVFTILIEEFSAQSYVGREGRKFHFSQFPFLLEADTQVNFGSWVQASPYYELVSISKGDGWFWFKQPITQFSTLTVSIANPFIEIALSKTVRTIIPLELIFLDNSSDY